MGSKRERYRLNVVGPFYVEDGCCTACGVPQSIAPELFAENDREHCFVRRQPETTSETDAMLRVIATQELGCIRYGGADPAILRRLVEVGEGDQCDIPPPPGIKPMRRDHATFVAREHGPAWTARRILERLVAFGTDWRTTSIHEADGSASVSVCWFEDNFHRIDAFTSNQPGRWVVRHHGPPRFSDTLHDWLAGDERFEDVRWQTKAQWATDGPSQLTPW